LKTSKLTSGLSFAINNPIKLIKHLSKALSKLHPIGEVASVASDGVFKLINEFSLYENELNEKLKPDDNKLIEFIEEKSNDIGSYVEYNLISELISNSISRIKKKKKIVLLIDDLDRLDPDHIFRLLNIFSSHHDYETKEHKFGFNKVILVCHLDNIKSIFHHKYGEKTDFQGYIDKFYSEEIFEFNNDDALDTYISSLNLNVSSHVIEVFRFLLRKLLNQSKLTMRNLIKQSNFESIPAFQYLEYPIKSDRHAIQLPSKIDRIWISSEDISILYIVKYFSIIFGSYTEAKKEVLSLGQEFGQIEEPLKPSIIESFALLNRIERYRNKENHLMIFFRSFGEKRFVADFDYPNEKFMGVNINYDIFWNARDQYDQNFSYFKDSEALSSNDDYSTFNNSLIFDQFVNLFGIVEKHSLKEKLQIVS